MKIKKLLFIFLVIITIAFVGLIIKYNYECGNYQSKDLKDENLKGFVKKITSNEVLDLSTNNLQIYDIDENLIMETNTSISVGDVFSENKKKSLILNNYFVCRYECDTLDNSNYKYFFESKKSELLNTIDIDLKENEEWSDYNISESDYLLIQLTRNDKIFKTYTVDENFNKSNYNCFSYDNEIEKKINCKTSKIIAIKKYHNDQIIESTSFSEDELNFTNFKSVNYYDNGLVIKNKIYDKDGVCWKFTNKKYDNNKNIIQSNTFVDISKSKYQRFALDELFNPSEESSMKWSYIYDSNNNWIEKTTIQKDGKTKTVKRKIEYYYFIDFVKNIF